MNNFNSVFTRHFQPNAICTKLLPVRLHDVCEVQFIPTKENFSEMRVFSDCMLIVHKCKSIKFHSQSITEKHLYFVEQPVMRYFKLFQKDLNVLNG